jgi:hypothetical protein
MMEPDWSALPFPTDRSRWRAYAETATAVEALNIIRDVAASAMPIVWLEDAAIDAVALAASVPHGEAFIEMGAGVLRFHRAGANDLGEGQAFADFRFRGAPNLQLVLARLSGMYLVHLPKE